MEPIRVLSWEQMERIDQAAREILAGTGMVIQSEEALGLLEKAGCQVDRGAWRVRFPKPVTAQTVDRMRADYAKVSRPQRMPVRYSHVRFRPVKYEVHQDFTASAGGFVPFIYDLDGRRRGGNRQDVLCSINLVNHLDQIDLAGLPVSDQDVPAPHRPIVMAAELAKYTKKLGGVEVFAAADVGFLCELGQIVAGSTENFRANPVMVGYSEVRSPLCFDRNMVEIFLEYIRRGVPQTVDCMPCGGATAPVTAAGILALGAAETIAPMVLAYALRDDAVVAMDINPSYADMSSGLFRYSGAERCRLLMARVQLLAEYYGCPTGVHGGKTDACFLNEHAGAEKMSSLLLAVLAGAVGVGTVGAVENAVTFSPVQLVLDNAMVAYARKAIQPVVVDEHTLAVDLIGAVGPGGNFLDQAHTAQSFRGELLLSELFPAQTWQMAQGRPEQFDATKRAAELARELWRPPEQSVLAEDQIRAIEALVARATS